MLIKWDICHLELAGPSLLLNLNTMTFNVYLPNRGTDYSTFFTSVEADNEAEAKVIVENMIKSGEIPEFYPY